MPTQEEYNASKQKNRIIWAKIDLLNFNFQKVDSLEGIVIGEPNIVIDSESDIRRICTFSLYPKNSSFDIKSGNKIWLDKYFQIYFGIKDNKTNEIIYSNNGIYLINNPSHSYSATNNTISIQGLDLMSKMTGMRNGNLEGIQYLIPEGSSIRDSIIATLILAGFNKYMVEDVVQTVPYDIKIDIGGTVYEILTALRDIVPMYQIYFDVDGVFHYEKIPSGANEQVSIDDDIWKTLLIDYNVDTDFSSVKNVIEVYGKMHDIENYGGVATINTNIYEIQLANIESLRNNLKIGFTATVGIANPYLKVNAFTEYPIKNEDGTIPILASSERYYVVKFIESELYFLFMGEVQPYAIVKESNPNSPFYTGSIGEIRKVLSGGEYDNITTDDLAKERANWELYNYARLQDSLTINCIPIYWIDVNKVIEITLPNKQGIEETIKYITKSVNTTFSTSGVQSIQCMKYYPFYNNI